MSASTRFDNALRYRDGSHERQRQLTPEYILEPVRTALGGIGLDPCTEPDNPTRAERFWTIEDDGLTADFWQDRIFCNPPYGKAREPWVRWCIDAGEHHELVVLLIPAATDTRIFQRALASAHEIVFIRGRVKFGTPRPNGRQEAASHPSALLGWNVDLTPCGSLGYRVLLTPPPALPLNRVPDRHFAAPRTYWRGGFPTQQTNNQDTVPITDEREAI